MGKKNERIQTPFQEAVKKILSNKLGLVSLIVLLILGFSLVGEGLQRKGR